MPELLHPGVYVQEVPSSVRPIEGVSTSTAAFIGVADKGPIPGTVPSLPNGRMAQPVMVTSFTEYNRQFGGFRQDSFLTYAVRAFFENGGRRLYIVRVAKNAAFALVIPPPLAAALGGTWSSLLRVSISPATNRNADAFDLKIRVTGQAGLSQIEQFTNLTVGTGGNAQTTINAGANASKFVRLTSQPTQLPGYSINQGLVGGADATDAGSAHVTTPNPNGITVNAHHTGTWANGNLTVAIAPASNENAFDLVVQLLGQEVERFPNLIFGNARRVVNEASQYIRLPTDLTARPTNTTTPVPLADGSNGAGGTAAAWPWLSALTISAVNQGAWGDRISVRIADSSDLDRDNFKLLVTDFDGTTVETFDNITYQNSPTLLPTARNPAQYCGDVINSRSEYIAINPTTPDFTSRPPNMIAPISLSAGSDGDQVLPSTYTGEEADNNTVTGTGLHALDKITDVNLIAIPGQGDADTVNKGMEYCKNQRPLQDCFFIGDVGSLDPGDARTDNATPTPFRLADARTFATGEFGGVRLNKAAGDYGAIYYPWVWATDPSPFGRGRNPRILLPPSGFLAGLYARIDNSRGVFKAPAGTEAGVAGAISTLTPVSDTEQDQLNPIMVNVIRTVPGSGFVVWGTRTIGSDASWRYIPVRRMAIFLRVSIYYGIQWAVFEPNGEPLWASLRLNIRAFMLTQFRAGAFQGGKPDDAFFVKCDSSTTTQQDIDNGVVNILVGFAPLKPAEFVILKLSQKVNQPAV
jgi:phage tail sheath protein FI